MEGTAGVRKHVGALTFSDFVAHPIWTWADEDDESQVMPVEYTGALPTEEEDIFDLFVACTFTFRDGMPSPGVLSVHVDNHRVYLIDFPGADGKLFDFPLQPELKGMVTRQQLADFLGKSVKSIFPITYDTPYVFSDGGPLKGTINY